MRMDAGLDTGPIVARRASRSRATRRPRTSRRALAELAADLLDRSLGPWLRGELAAAPQPAEGVTLTRPLRREDGRLDPPGPPSSWSAGCAPTCRGPARSSRSDGERLVVTAAVVAPSEPGDVPGRLVRHGDRPALATVDGRLVLDAVTPPGRRAMSGADYLRGRRAPHA